MVSGADGAEAQTSGTGGGCEDVGEKEKEAWFKMFRSLVFGDDSDRPSNHDEVITRCATLAAELRRTLAELVSICIAEGNGKDELKIAVSDRLFLPTERSGNSRRRQSVTKKFRISRHLGCSPLDVYDMHQSVGEGTFGSVCQAYHKQSGQSHAIKTVPKVKINGDELFAEIDLLKQLDHPHILRLYSTFEDEENIYMASEICAGGEFFDTLARVGSLEEHVAARLFKQILGAVVYLHGKCICHRDLKPENFLVSKKVNLDQLDLKLIDFGTAKNFENSPLTTKVCTRNYVAPEVLKRGDVQYSEKVDIWSSGVILFMMLCGFMPFDHQDEVELMRLVKKGKYEFRPAEVWGAVSGEAKELVKGTLCVNVTKRFSGLQANKHEWFARMAGSQQWSGPTNSPTATIECETDGMAAQMWKFVRTNRLKRVALMVIARQVCDSSIKQIREIFMSFDKDCSGTLSYGEMSEALEKMNVNEKTRKEMLVVMNHLDEDGSGHIEYTEFIAATMNPKQYLQIEACRAAFDVLDADANGVITKDDLSQLFMCETRASEYGLSEKHKREINHIIQQVDDDGNGQVNFEEFMMLMSGKQPHKYRRLTTLHLNTG